MSSGTCIWVLGEGTITLTPGRVLALLPEHSFQVRVN